MTEKPRIRVIKADSEEAQRRPGLVEITDASGRTKFRGPCDRCGKDLVLRFAPKQGEPMICRTCRNIEETAKPGTVPVHGRGATKFNAPCDICGKRVTVSFMPKTERPFTCAECHHDDAAIQEAPAEPVPSDAPSDRRYHANCRTCGTRMNLKFKLGDGERLQCPACYSKQKEAARRGHRPRVMFNIECAECGRKEMLDFVPKDRDRPLCSRCQEAKRRRRRP